MAVATHFSTVMSQLTGNTGGQVQALPFVNVAGARNRIFVATITLAAQASGSVIGVARLPMLSAITGITLVTDTSLGTATIALGDTNNAARFLAAQTFTTINTPTRVGLTSAHGVPITSGYDCVSGLASLTYEDMVLTTAVASLPGSGNFTIIIEYALD